MTNLLEIVLAFNSVNLPSMCNIVEYFIFYLFTVKEKNPNKYSFYPYFMVNEPVIAVSIFGPVLIATVVACRSPILIFCSVLLFISFSCPWSNNYPINNRHIKQFILRTIILSANTFLALFSKDVECTVPVVHGLNICSGPFHSWWAEVLCRTERVGPHFRAPVKTQLTERWSYST